jgi:hypothetical protein
MVTSSNSTTQFSENLMAKFHSAPYIGLVAITLTLLWKMIAHATTVVFHTLTHGPMMYIVSGLIGLFGFTLVWIGFKKDELTATYLGYMGGSFVFMGWFEGSFEGFSQFLKIPPLMQDGYTIYTPNLLLIQASAVLYFAMLIFAGANKDTRCRMFLWFHRNLKLRPNQPTPGYKRQFARITAMEAVFVSWFFYIVILFAVDPRILGLHHPATYLLTGAVFIWGIWLLFAKLLKYQAMASAIRYAVPTSGALWFCVEMTSLWNWYPEIWVKPFEFPLTNLSLALSFLLLGVIANMTAQRGGSAAP